MSVMIVTSLGDLVIDLFADRCPLTCKNFLKLCKIKYYNGCLFHTVQKDFTAQTGDPTGTGSGGDSVYNSLSIAKVLNISSCFVMYDPFDACDFRFLYGDQARFFSDEIRLDVKHSKMGTVAMASAGENLNASQVFGEVAEGIETLTRINEAYVDEKSRPYKNIRIKHTYILDDPFDDPPQLADLIPDASPEGKPKDEVDDDVRLEDDWIPLDEQLNPHELEEVLRAKDAHSRAVVLETIGDIPDAEIKPPDNVLFVCKLNPVTEDEDLHTIFSRFGVVTSAEVIRDHKTGDSLCYAFIEFEDKDACEQAYFKMDNALIDDRRIHVDFSQSVAKLWSQYRRKGQGGGCYKCGSVDHMAKDCTGDSTSKHSQSKYTLKDDNIQRGGDKKTRYEMVFEEDNGREPKHSKRRRDHKPGHEEKRDRHDEPRHYESSHKQNEEYVGRKRSPEINRSGERRKPSARDNRDEREQRRGHDKGYIRSHGEERDYGSGRGERKKEYESRKKSEDEYVRGSQRDRRGVEDDSYGHRRLDGEWHSDKRSSKR
ncbi:peptidyl-prolyl cis-trans isomerase-like protein [Striga asiatica]|uniref:Peptidyl-prolyl cis-trans isomerase n=1 Tax=Striga asiatica TaxID=4170 RepID=A0A5A7R510_STRAF|nr:peptidyl-prolyl cis-trans isomerase-like protein [Striga asiatica]